MTPNRRASLALAAGLCLACALPAAAETCLRDPTPTNSAFGAPRPCPEPKLAVPTKGKAKTGSDVVKTSRPDGTTVYVTPDTQVTVSGYVEVTVGTGGRMRK
jgi:hypothetical protein